MTQMHSDMRSAAESAHIGVICGLFSNSDKLWQVWEGIAPGSDHIMG